MKRNRNFKIHQAVRSRSNGVLKTCNMLGYKAIISLSIFHKESTRNLTIHQIICLEETLASLTCRLTKCRKHLKQREITQNGHKKNPAAPPYHNSDCT